ncbi:MAG: hypothetical protein ACD_45C00477G0004 [uncultured bacterium]|nr:MAG: hypothetical protein ACD_45C00477G0004 [uncultured bacterium]
MVRILEPAYETQSCCILPASPESVKKPVFLECIELIDDCSDGAFELPNSNASIHQSGDS